MDRLEAERMFAAVLDHGSFAEAARRLGSSSGQASKLVARLESELGVQLLKRTTRALAPTEAGQAYYLRIRDLLSEFDALTAAVRNASGAPAGRLRLSAPLTWGTLRLTPLLLEFAAAFPGIDLDVSFTDRLVNLVDEGFDLAVRIGDPPDSSLMARRLGDMHLHLVASPGFLAREPGLAGPGDLTGRACIIDSNFRDPRHWRFADGLLVPVSGRLRFSSAEACLQAALAGLGYAQLPGFVSEDALARGALQRLLPGHEPPVLAVHAVYPPTRHLAAKVRALVDFLHLSLRGKPASPP